MRIKDAFFIGFGIFILVLTAPTVALPQDNDNWWWGFHPPGVKKDGWPGKVNVVVSRGYDIYIGGDFDHVGLVPANNIACWNDHRWHALDEGVNGEVHTIYAAMEALFVAGSFTEAGGEPALYLARWADFQWHRMGDHDFDGPVHAFEYHNAALYVGGRFTQYGTTQMWHLARWVDTDWEQAETHGPVCYTCWPSEIRALKHYNGRLWVGGTFDNIDASWIFNIAAWDEDNGYQLVGTGGGAQGGMGNVVTCFEDQPATLYFGGEFINADWEDCLGLGYSSSSGEHLHGITPYQPADYWVRDLVDLGISTLVVTDKWLRTRGAGVWGSAKGSMRGASCACQDGGYLYAGGELIGESLHTDAIARWDGQHWLRVGAGLAYQNNYGDEVRSVTSYDGDLFIGGNNTGVRSVAYLEDDCAGSVLFDGQDIIPLEPCISPITTSLVYQGQLYVGGEFNPGEDWHLSRIARRVGDDWESLGGGVGAGSHVSRVNALTVWEGLLIIGGQFTDADGLACDNLVAWDGTFFNQVDDADFSSDICAVLPFAGDLIVGGKFTTIDGAPYGRIARWDGESWSDMNGGFDHYVESLEVWEGELYAGGRFSNANGVSTPCIARWDGAAWRPLGDGIDGDDGVLALQASDVGLFAGGDFFLAGGAPASAVARWTGATWEPLGDGITGGPGTPTVRDFCIHEGHLYMVGTFLYAGGKISANIARWSEEMTPVVLNSFDLDTQPGEVEIRWEIAETQFLEQRLEARLGDTRWSPDFFEEGQGRYRCYDRSSWLRAGGEVEYLLQGREAGEEWALLRRARVAVEALPTVASPEIAVWPNPANPSFHIELNLPASATVKVAVLSIAGRLLKTLHEGPLAAGEHHLNWAGRDEAGQELASGVYLLSLHGPAGSSCHRLVLVR